jgi:hypothetical protein
LSYTVLPRSKFYQNPSLDGFLVVFSGPRAITPRRLTSGEGFKQFFRWQEQTQHLLMKFDWNFSTAWYVGLDKQLYRIQGFLTHSTRPPFFPYITGNWEAAETSSVYTAEDFLDQANRLPPTCFSVQGIQYRLINNRPVLGVN